MGFSVAFLFYQDLCKNLFSIANYEYVSKKTLISRHCEPRFCSLWRSNPMSEIVSHGVTATFRAGKRRGNDEILFLGTFLQLLNKGDIWNR